MSYEDMNVSNEYCTSGVQELQYRSVKGMRTKAIREPAVAGMFYPADATELRRDVTNYIEHGKTPQPLPTLKALIAPHAGYIYSGPIAGSAYACLSSLRSTITRVVIFGPSHRVGFRGIAASNAEAFQTPLGDVPVDTEACEATNRFPFVFHHDLAHRDEHGLEVQLPFLQVMLNSFTIAPFVVGDATGNEVAEVIEALWGGPETLVVISSDLSHYLTYNEAVALDKQTSESIEQLAPDEISANQACGRLPIKGLLLNAKKHHLHPQTIDLRNSGDTAGDKRQVVGYGAYVFCT